MRASLDLQLEHMKLTAYFPVSRFVSFDGMDNGPHKFKNNSCWGPVGIAAETKQYQIDTRFFFSVLATYSYNGQSHDDRSVTDPVGLLNEAFARYSENNPQGRVAANGNWTIYTNNNNRLLSNVLFDLNNN